MPSHSFSNLGATEHNLSDLYFVAIFSPKVVRIGDVCIQLNYLNRDFCEFFADRTAARTFWSLARQKDRAGVLEQLDAHPAFRAYGA
jgi:hypothetical protein